ncbi:hypothetical protein OBBRIDRAFT_832352 [Obba rivulosa]|uniref:Uncharacterized protein n=1 Tax=Obba rivulosa TaxID=1052685 RepID=A0A8E2DQ52_9APHY|nr:hypothetical protein OBBRIDRAFT_832352 [Obba rivulosa]
MAQIAPLLAFRNLESLILHLNTPVDLEDEALGRLVKAWPSLRTLHIGHLEPFFMPRLTYDALVVLAIHSPRLESLEIVLDMRSFTIDNVQRTQRDPRAMTSLKQLAIGGYEVCDALCVAHTLYMFFPNLSFLATTSSEDHIDEWKDVARTWGIAHRKGLQRVQEKFREELRRSLMLLFDENSLLARRLAIQIVEAPGL